MFNVQSEDFHSATAKTVEEAKKLIETSFEYVRKHENVMLFKKR